MNIRTVRVQPLPQQDEGEGDELVMLEVSGTLDPNNETLKRARELVLKTGSQDMIESFDWALERGAFGLKR